MFYFSLRINSADADCQYWVGLQGKFHWFYPPGLNPNMLPEYVAHSLNPAQHSPDLEIQ